MIRLENTVKAASSKCFSAVAAGTGDATAITLAAVDRMAAGRAGYDRAIVAIIATTVLTEAKTLAGTLTIAESDDNSTFDTAETLDDAVVLATGGSGGTTVEVFRKVAVDLKARKRYAKFAFTPNLSHTATDTAVGGVALFLGEAHELPAA